MRPNNLNIDKHLEIEEQVKQFLDRGGMIQQVPIEASADPRFAIRAEEIGAWGNNTRRINFYAKHIKPSEEDL